MKLEIIAECGVNHNGSFETAVELVENAKKCGADTVKFQLFKTSSLLRRSTELAEYQKLNTIGSQSQNEMLEKLELSINEHKKLIEICADLKIRYLTSVFDLESLSLLKNELKQQRVKFGSGELSNLPLLRAAALNQMKIILSVGMSDYRAINDALTTISLAIEQPDLLPTSKVLEHFSPNYDILRETVSILHCTSQYPTPYEDVNLLVLNSLKKNFPINIGFSDHSRGIEAAVASVGLNIKVLEKHFTLDKKMEGPDHMSSLEPDEFRALVSSVRIAEKAMGSQVKRILENETELSMKAKKSLVASRKISVGEIFTEQNLTTKRPGVGIAANLFYDFIGKMSDRDYEADDFIC